MGVGIGPKKGEDTLRGGKIKFKGIERIFVG